MFGKSDRNQKADEISLSKILVAVNVVLIGLFIFLCAHR